MRVMIHGSSIMKIWRLYFMKINGLLIGINKIDLYERYET